MGAARTGGHGLGGLGGMLYRLLRGLDRVALLRQAVRLLGVVERLRRRGRSEPGSDALPLVRRRVDVSLVGAKALAEAKQTRKHRGPSSRTASAAAVLFSWRPAPEVDIFSPIDPMASEALFCMFSMVLSILPFMPPIVSFILFIASSALPA